MADVETISAGFDFRLTSRQRRVRIMSAVILAAILAMVVTGMKHPFFRSPGDPAVRQLAREAIAARRAGLSPPAAAERARRAVATRIAVIGAYWSVCFGLSGVLLILAWLDVREIRKKLLEARLGALKRAASSPRSTGGNGHHRPAS